MSGRQLSGRAAFRAFIWKILKEVQTTLLAAWHSPFLLFTSLQFIYFLCLSFDGIINGGCVVSACENACVSRPMCECWHLWLQAGDKANVSLPVFYPTSISCLYQKDVTMQKIDILNLKAHFHFHSSTCWEIIYAKLTGNRLTFASQARVFYLSSHLTFDRK